MTDQVAQLEAWANEDGDEWYIAGHHPKRDAIRAVRRATIGWWGRGEVLNSDFAVRHAWYRDARDFKDDERWERCEEGDDGAEPFTVVTL